jgi:transcriptional regulator with XRE-family HTH domain
MKISNCANVASMAGDTQGTLLDTAGDALRVDSTIVGGAQPTDPYHPHMSTWWPYVQRYLDKYGWTPSDLSRHADINRSIISRWKEGAKPEVETVRRVANAFNRPLAEVLIASGLVTKDELAIKEIAVSPLDEVSDTELLAELGRRMAAYRAAGQSDHPADRTLVSRVHTTDAELEASFHKDSSKPRRRRRASN